MNKHRYKSKCKITSILILGIWIFLLMPGISQNQTNFITLNPVHKNELLSFTSSLEDEYGYMWLTHNSGFYKYDGYQYTLISYKEILGDQFTNDRNFITHKDGRGNFWVSTMSGELTRFNSDEFIRSFKDSLNYQDEGMQLLSYISKNDDVWMGSDRGMLLNYNYNRDNIQGLLELPKEDNQVQGVKSVALIDEDHLMLGTTTGNIYRYSLSEKKLDLILGLPMGFANNIRVISDLENQVWIFTNNVGSYVYNIKTEEIEEFTYPSNHLKGPQINSVYFVFCDSSGYIWVGTDGYGLYRIDPKTKSFENFVNNPLNNFSLKNNTVLHLNEDSHKNIWVITKGGHIQIIPNIINEINYLSGSENQKPARILSILKDTHGEIWTGTDGQGLNRNYPDDLSRQYGLDPLSENGFKGEFVQSLAEDNYGNIWIGTYLNGLWIYNRELNYFEKISISNPAEIFASDIRFIYKDYKNRIWVTTDVGIYVFSDKKKLLARFIGHDNGLYGGISQSICEDSQNRLWIGINQGGLFLFEENDDDFSNSSFSKRLYHNVHSDKKHNYNIASMSPDQNGNIWIVTISGALICYNTFENNFSSYLEKEELKNITFNSIQVEDTNNLWLSSNNGIIHYNLKNNTIEHYYQIDGLQGNIFLRRSSFKDGAGNIYFGGINGMNYFFPDNMRKKESFSNLYIHSIEILNQPAKSIVRDQITKGIINVEKLILSSEQSSFSLRFSALDNLLSSNFHYAYRLRGFNDNWIEPEREFVATYTNIKHGKYTFEVKAGSKKGIWDIPAKSISIHILPPWYMSKWAYLIYLIILGIIAFSIINWLKLRKKLAEEEWEHQKDKEMYALKMNFFTKMSHEIQTPLTLIRGPIEDIMMKFGNKTDPPFKKRLNIIASNAKRLSHIAMEMTSSRNLELGRLKMNVANHDIIHHLKAIAISFEELARFKKIQFNEDYTFDNLMMSYDRAMIEHAIFNLLSNAFKFTPPNGKIKIHVNHNTKNQKLEISVHDSGPGISKEDKDRIFNLYFQSDLGKEKKGMGIGLALAKEFIELHHGEIKVSSTQGKGSCFTASLSTKQHIFNTGENQENLIGIKAEELAIASIPVIAKDKGNSKKKKQSLIENGNGLIHPKDKSLLIVEDNFQMQLFLESVFSDRYTLTFANDGKEGVQMAESKNPNLIISDILMPRVDGIEMSKILQQKKSTRHIPIILMSARNQDKIRYKGLQSGAIEYIHKPFNIQELILKVNNIINRSENVISKYRRDLLSNPKHPNEESMDDLFLNNLVTEISKQIDNPDFKLEDLSDSLNMSYSAIYRKCQSLTGKSLVEFMRTIKIKKAALLIIKFGHSISEGAYLSGFNDPKYFTKCFKKEYGKSPMSLKKEALNEGLERTIQKYFLENVPVDYKASK